MKSFVRLGSILCSLITAIVTAQAATVTWTGAGGDSSWHTSANWSGGIAPGANDDVVINGAGEVVFSTGSVMVRSIQSSRTLTLSGGNLTLTSGNSSISGTFQLKSGVLWVRGAGTRLTASGGVIHQGTDVTASDGGSILLNQLASINVSIPGNARFRASDPGSRIDLPSLTEATVKDFYSLELDAVDGGQIATPKLKAISGGTVDFYAEGDGSAIDISGFQGTMTNLSSSVGKIEARNGASLAMANVTKLDKINLILRGEVNVPTAQIVTFANAYIELSAHTNNFPGLTTFTNASFYVENGAKATLSGITNLVRSIAGDLTLSADGEESVLQLPNLTQATTPDFYHFEVLAYNGGTVSCPKLAKLNAALSAYADGDGSALFLTGLTGLLTNSTSALGLIEARSGSTINIPNITALSRIDVAVRDSGEITTAQLRSVTLSTITVDGKAAAFPTLTNIEGTSITIQSGGELTLSGVTRLSRSISGSIRYRAADEGSVLNLPNVTEAAVTDFYSLELFAEDGGKVTLPKLSKFTGSINAIATGETSIVDLSGFTGTLANSSSGQAYLEARDGGLILLPGVKALQRINLELARGGSISAQLSSFTEAELTIDGMDGSFSSLTNINGSSISLENGAKLTLTGITQMTRSKSGSMRLSADDPGSALALPNLTEATLVEGYQFELFATGGGSINLPVFRKITGALDVIADGNGSMVSLPGLTGILANTTSTSGYFEVKNGGSVLMPNVTGLEKYSLTLRGSGAMSIAQLTSIRNSSVYIDGQSAAFTSLVDTTGTTFRYENGGTGVFQPPADLTVSAIRVPSTINAGQQTEIVWELTNVGTSFTNGIWTDSVYISADNVPGNDELVGTFQVQASLTPNAKLLVTNKVVVPARSAGQKFVVVAANTTRTLFEGVNYGNNTNVSSQVAILAPDLLIESGSVQPTSTQFGQVVTLSYSGKNIGTLAAAGPWNDRIYLAKATNSLNGAIFITNIAAASSVAANGSYNRNVSIQLPIASELAEGSYFLAIYGDYSGSVSESNEENNVRHIPLSLSRPPLPDLTPTQVSSLALAKPGEQAIVTWVTTNIGNAVAQGAWTESVFLLSTNGASTNQLLASFRYTNSLAVGSALVRTQQVVIPQDARAGSARFAVEVDAELEVVEKVETNNTSIASQTINISPVLTINSPVSKVPENTVDRQITALVNRNGNLSVPLTVNVTSSDSKELVVPTTVSFRAGDVSAVLDITVQADGIPDGNKEVTISPSAAGYDAGSTKITVENTDVPNLSLQLAVARLNEGEATDLTVSHDGQFVVPITVNLSANGNDQLALPPTVTIPAGQSSVVVEVGALDDTRVEADRSYTIRAANAGFIPASINLEVHDNDLPQFSFAVGSTNLSEGAGAQATVGVISRGSGSPRSLTVELQNSNPSLILAPASVVIPSGEASVTFPIGVVDNSSVDGTRNAVLKAFALSTGAEQRIAETAPVAINVLDNDGPTLSVSISHELVAEGVQNAATVTVTRNTAPTQPVVVTLSSSLPTEATVPQSITIAQGATSATAILSTKDDGIPDGSKVVEISASAVGYTSGKGTVTVTDTKLPDLVARDISGPSTAETEAFVNVGYRIYNQGLATAGTNWTTRIYLSDDPVVGNDTLLNEYAFNGNLPVGQFFGQTRQVRLPQTPGNYWVVVQTDTANQIDEVLEQNNVSISPQPISVSTAYSASVVADLETAQAGTPIPLHGSAVKAGTAGPAPFALVNIHIQVRGTKRIISALADESGKFSAVFKPLLGEAGFYEIGAAHPGAATAPIQDSFTLFGIKADQVPTVQLSEKSSITGQFAVQNLGDRALTQLVATVGSKPANLQVTATVSTNTLVGLGTVTVGYAITALDATSPSGTVEVVLTTAQGAKVTVPIAVTVDSLRPKLITNPGELIRGMKVGGQTFVEFDVINNGGTATGPLDVSLPDAPWMHLTTVAPLPSIPPHGSNRVTLQLTPTANLTLGAYEGRIALNATNASLLVPYTFRALSEARGDLLITAVDEYTYFAEGSPKVAGASVQIRDAVTLDVVTNGVTDAQGRFLLRNIQEGYYELELKADKHTAFREPRLILAGQTNEVQAFLRREAVRYVWKVVPTEIQDRTKITIETVFEAFVPMPVVTVEPPLIDLADFTAEVTQIDMKVMNHGLIAAKEAKLTFEQHPDWSIEPLVEELGDIPARGSFTVPVIVRRLTPGLQRGFGRMHALAGGACTIAGNCRFVVECGGSKLPGGADVPVINASASGNCGGGGGGGMPFGGGGGRGGEGGSGGGPGDSSAAPASCDDCTMALAKAILDCALKFVLSDAVKCAKDSYGCVTGIKNNGPSLGGGYKCAKAVIACAKAAGKKIPLVGGLKYIECAYGILKPCDKGGGGSSGGGGGGGSSGGSNGGGGSENGNNFAKAMSAAETAGFDGFGAAALDLFWFNDSARPFGNRLQNVQKFYRPMIYVFGNEAWLRDETNDKFDLWTDAFLQAIDEASVEGAKISAAERSNLLAIPHPITVSVSMVEATIARWNRSLDYWAAGIYRAAEVPAGQSSDFIALDYWDQLSESALGAFDVAEREGYSDPLDALQKFGDEFQQFLTEGDGNGVCAHVRLRLEQEAVMTRDAFDATLEVANDTASPIENVGIEVHVRRRSGEDSTELFAIRPPKLTNVTAIDGTGRISTNATGAISWTLIPTTDTAKNGPEEFLVGGVLRYVQDGLNITVPLAPSSITVLPSPSLAVKYFHERQVFADDPFTTAIEPSVPYSLAVMVQNKGLGTARNVHIDSAQPKIVENEKGLLADFKIIATQVEEDSLQPSLSVDFGQINPGTNVIGRWLLTSTILGGFIDYSATFEHLDGLGNKKLSLVEGVEIHELIHIVRATGANDDGRPDFLVNDIADLYDRPDTLHLSDGSVKPVAVVLEGKTDRAPSSGNLEVHLTATMPAGFTYLRIADPGDGKYRLSRVVRSDGFEVPLGENVWTTDRTFLGNARRPVVENTIHLFDRDSTGSYTLFYVPAPAGDEVPPASSVAPLPAESAALFPVAWSGQDNQGGSGISFYDVYVSVDNGPFNLWISETIDRSAVYQGGLGRSYAFYSVATDVAGNREEPPSVPDARTTITRTNHAPVLELIADQAVREGQTLTIQPVATDNDGDELIYSLSTNAPLGIVINPYTGKISWATTEGSGPKSYPLTLTVLDSGLPRLGSTRSFIVTVTDENSPPIITPVSTQTIREGQALTFTAVANDIDLPAQAVTFRLDKGAPEGATLSTNGLFSWRPNDFQGGQTYNIGIIATDDGSPIMSSTQRFSVIVRDTRSDVVLRVGDTNVIAGGAISLPITLSSGSDLKSLAFELSVADPHITDVQLSPAGTEIASASLEPLESGRYRIAIELDPARIQSGTRAVGTLSFGTKATGRSSIAFLSASALQAVRQNGDTIPNTSLGGGRIFAIENEPLMDTVRAPNNNVRVIFYAKPGTQLIMEDSPDLRGTGGWVESTGLTMSTTFHQMTVPSDLGARSYFRLKRAN